MNKMTKTLYRAAAVIFLLFATGHTAGFLTFRPKSPDGLAVFESMRSVRFQFGGSSGSWLGFYTGFGLFVSVYMIFSIFLAWRLSNTRPGEISMARTLAWILFAVQLANVAVCFAYFGPVQVAFAAACAATIGFAALQTRPQLASAP
jgi:pheromone shutdown protein TraB